jgi:hypothetical protein
MIGFNGGLIGKNNPTVAGTSIPGVWTLREQEVAIRRNQWTGIADPSYSNVSLLLYCDGANGSTTITDSSPSPKTVTAVGNAQISTAQSKFGGASLLLDGTGDYGLIDTQMTDFEYTADFTVEGFFYFNVNNAGYQAGVGTATGADSTGWNLYIENDNTITFLGATTTSWNTICGSTQVPSTSVWHHIAASRSGSTVRLFYNGTQIGSTTSSNSIRSGSELRIGGYAYFPGGARSFNGYIDEVRITKGVARYTAAFTPPTAAFSNF